MYKEICQLNIVRQKGFMGSKWRVISNTEENNISKDSNVPRVTKLLASYIPIIRAEPKLIARLHNIRVTMFYWHYLHRASRQFALETYD